MSVRDAIWEDPRHRASYEADLSSLPEGYLGEIDPSRFSSQGALYAAQYDAYTSYVFMQQSATLEAHGVFPPGPAATTWSGAEGNPTGYGPSPEEVNRNKAKKSVYQQALNLAAHVEKCAKDSEYDPWASPEAWWNKLRQLQLAIEAFEDGDETEEELKQRLDRYLDQLGLSEIALRPPYKPPLTKPVQSSEASSESDEDELEESDPPTGAWRRFMQWLHE